jgi:diacylglycerol kinase family enzyme
MQPADLHASLARILAHSPSFPDESLAVDLIANPRAGGFTRTSYARSRFAELDRLVARAEALAMRDKPVSLRLHLTERAGHASEIAQSIIRDAQADAPGTRRIIFTAGGDGTSLETASVLVELPRDIAGRFALVRLPFGTGNDGAEGRTLESALERFLGPVIAAPRAAIKVSPNPAGGKSPLWSFNIASVGLDAFVCLMTNRLKTFFPGDSYKLWVDFASVFYDLIWPPAPLAVRALDSGGKESFSFTKPCLLFAAGVSGHRTYGSNKRIFPDEDNACAAFQMPLLKKLAFKDKFSAGEHRGLGEDYILLSSGRRFELGYAKGILLQRDGEVTELGPEDFPLVMEVSEPLYNVVEASPA